MTMYVNVPVSTFDGMHQGKHFAFMGAEVALHVVQFQAGAPKQSEMSATTGCDMVAPSASALASSCKVNGGNA